MASIIQFNPTPSKENMGKQMMSESKFFMGYSRWDDSLERYETWPESVSRVMAMHRDKFADKLTPELEEYFAFAEQSYKNKSVLGAQRALQFGGAQLRKHEARMFNCGVSYCDRAAFFQETMYLLLCGSGIGFSVQKQHVDKLPSIKARAKKRVKVFQIPDSIEGWADAFGVLLSSYLESDPTFPEYQGVQVHFDFSLIRPKGAEISGGFKAPGPDGLQASLIKCEALLNKTLEEGNSRIKPIVAYDFTMHMADAVLSGGVRRSATICVFDKDDAEMLSAKTGDWFINNPQRGRSNNSVILERSSLTRDEWAQIMKSVKDFGEPGFIFTDSLEFLFNPCVEIGMRPVTLTGVSGFQFCNLTEINGGQCDTVQKFYQACKAAAILGTLQAGYTNFKYVSSATAEITAHEALIGVSITGWMNNPDILFDEETLKKGAEIVKRTNREVAKLLGINPAARTTCVKPSGNASVLLGTASGIHGEHAPRYIRNVQMNKEDEVAKLFMEKNPDMCEPSVWGSSDIVVSFPITCPEGSMFKEDLQGIKQLEYVKKAQQTWVEFGTDENLCVDKRLRHNVSNTITVDDWDEVEQYLFDNRQWFTGVSLLAAMGDKAYMQAPFTEVLTAEQILARYGDAGLFASGLIVDGLQAYANNLWQACDTALGHGLELSDKKEDLLKRDWVRRFKQFAVNYFGGDKDLTAACLKDCYNLHKWNTIHNAIHLVDFAKELNQPSFTDVDTLASEACAGGACEVNF